MYIKGRRRSGRVDGKGKKVMTKRACRGDVKGGRSDRKVNEKGRISN
jgi:hypothetical protein